MAEQMNYNENKEVEEEASDDLQGSYRQGLVDTQRKLNENYDKLVITLSGGALALSLAFIKDVVGPNEICQPRWLSIAWLLFIVSLTSILLEILTGISAHKCAIKQVDDKSIHRQKVGGKSARISEIFRWVAMGSLISGLICISVFTFFNLGAR